MTTVPSARSDGEASLINSSVGPATPRNEDDLDFGLLKIGDDQQQSMQDYAVALARLDQKEVDPAKPLLRVVNVSTVARISSD